MYTNFFSSELSCYVDTWHQEGNDTSKEEEREKF